MRSDAISHTSGTGFPNCVPECGCCDGLKDAGLKFMSYCCQDLKASCERTDPHFLF